MRSAIPAREWPARNVTTAGFNCAKIMPSRVEHVSRFSAALPFPTSSATLKACTWGTSRTKKGLSSEHWRITQNGLLVRLPFQFHFLHLFICHRHCVRRLPRFAPIEEVVFRMGKISRAENVGTE